MIESPIRCMFGVILWQDDEAVAKKVNWANKMQSNLDSISDPVGGMMTDKVWGALATKALERWKENMQKVHNNSESGGRLKILR